MLDHLFSFRFVMLINTLPPNIATRKWSWLSKTKPTIFTFPLLFSFFPSFFLSSFLSFLLFSRSFFLSLLQCICLSNLLLWSFPSTAKFVYSELWLSQVALKWSDFEKYEIKHQSFKKELKERANSTFREDFWSRNNFNESNGHVITFLFLFVGFNCKRSESGPFLSNYNFFLSSVRMPSVPCNNSNIIYLVPFHAIDDPAHLIATNV